MDDLKLFDKNEDQLSALLFTVKMFSDDVGLTFGLDKCAKISVKRGSIVSSDDVVLCDNSCIRELNTGESCKYLGFFESDGVDCVASKKTISELYSYRLRLVWKSVLVKLERLIHFVSQY